MTLSTSTSTRPPAAATLFALWMTTPEAQDIWQPTELAAAIYPSAFGQSKVDQEVAALATNARIVSYLDNARTAELLAWYATPEGSQYAQAIAEALRGQ